MRVLFFCLLSTGGLLLNFNCSSSQATPPAPDRLTEKFSAYLKANFDDSIPGENHLYFLIAKKESPENISQILLRLKDELRQMPKEHYTMIFNAAVPVPDSLIPKGNSQTDWDGEIEKLELNLAGVTIIQTTGHKVNDVLRLDKEVFGMEQKFLNW
ncbi:MAG: hypothetical protein M3R17_03185 [Bacteroidota bacterium]|nr:hypothetical protein [Bacteroidota bacterium]